MLKPLDYVNVKIERAKKHIHDLDDLFGAYNKSGPYRTFPEEEPQTGDIVFRIEIKRTLPLSCFAAIGDAVQNLRSALDYLAYQLVLAQGRAPTKGTAFPVFRGPAAEYKAFSKRKVKGMSQAAQDRIELLQPYHGRCDALWVIDELNNIDKHRLLLPLGTAHTDVILDYRDMFPNVREPMLYTVLPSGPSFAERSFPLKNGAEIYRVLARHRDTYINQKPQFTLTVTLGEPEIVKGKPIIPTLLELAQAVEIVTSGFKNLL